MIRQLKNFLFGTLPNDPTKFYNGSGGFSTPSGSTPPGNSQTSFLVSGGGVAWIQDYDFTVSAANYFIQGLPYTSPQTDITLDPSDPTDDRIDLIIVDSSGAVDFITGTASSTPSEPDYDPGTQLKLAIVFVPAASTEPVVNTEIVYFENAGGPGEWNWTEVGTTFDPNSTNNPKAPATKDIEGTTASNGDYAQGAIPASSYLVDDANLLILWIRSKATWANNRGLSISLRTAGVLQGTSVAINRTGSFGFDSSITGTYQQIAIPISLFSIPAGQTITQIRITAFGNGHGFYIGDIYFQEQGVTQPPIGVTQEQADARYLQRANNLSDITDAATARANIGAGTGGGSVSIISIGITVDGGGSNPVTAGSKSGITRRIPQAGTIIGWTISADQIGDIEFDVFLDDPTSTYPPATSIVAAAPPELTGGTEEFAEDTTLTGWTTAVSAGDMFAFGITSTSGVIQRVTLQIDIAVS